MSVVVRFAPSPTGYLHVGGQRTALYNYLFAKQHQGKFILRIEDTDQNRIVDGAVENLLKSLEMMGLHYDNGPHKDDENGPYFQSKRLELYKKEIARLLKDGQAYRCFCTPERLTKLREKQVSNSTPPGYDGKCRHLTEEESDILAKTNSFVIRMKVPKDEELEFEDMIRGTVKVHLSTVDDQVLLKTDGFPTYHLANVVDDHYMKVSHVIRGEEWLPSLPKHILLYRFLGWTTPQFAHLPLLLNSDRSKLSKRQGDVAVEDYLKKGYLPETLNNFLALLGWNPGTDKELFSMEELIENFSLERVNKSGAIFDLNKLNWMSSQYIQKMEINTYLSEAKKWLGDSDVNNEKADIALLAIKTSLTKFTDIPEKIAIFTSSPSQPDNPDIIEILTDPRTQKVFTEYIERISELSDYQLSDFKATMSGIQKDYKKEGFKGKFLWMPIRLALTAQMHGPELGYIAEYLGKDENISRVKTALKWIESL